MTKDQAIKILQDNNICLKCGEEMVYVAGGYALLVCRRCRNEEEMQLQQTIKEAKRVVGILSVQAISTE